MRIPLLSSIALLPLAVLANHHDSSNARRHSELALRQRGEVNHLQKRSYSGQATWFNVGLGACGQWSQPTDWIVALDTPLYGSGYPGPHCFASITIQSGEKSAVATIMDECPTCNYGDLDMSQGLFEHFQPLGVGVFPITWWYNDGNDQPAPPPPPPPPPATTHHTTPKPSPTPAPTSTTSRQHSNTATATQSAGHGDSDTPDNAASDPTPENLLSFNTILINLGALVVGAGSS